MGLQVKLTDKQVELIEKRGLKATAGEIKHIVEKWQLLISAGWHELEREFKPEELSEIYDLVLRMAKIDSWNAEELWGMSAARLSSYAIVLGRRDYGERILDLSELAILALKEYTADKLSIPTGSGGRPTGSGGRKKGGKDGKG